MAKNAKICKQTLVRTVHESLSIRAQIETGERAGRRLARSYLLSECGITGKRADVYADLASLGFDIETGAADDVEEAEEAASA